MMSIEHLALEVSGLIIINIITSLIGPGLFSEGETPSSLSRAGVSLRGDWFQGSLGAQ